MKRLLSLLAFAAFLLPSLQAADTKAQLEELVGKVKAKLSAGARTEAELSDELKAFDALLSEHKAEKTDEVAQIAIMKAMLYVQVLKQPEKGKQELQKMKADFPETQQAKRADTILASIDSQAAAEKTREDLKPGAAFPAFEEKDLEGKPLSLANYKGKVVLIDFWATWCGPCVAELPNVLKAYEKYHGQGFEIIGISLDQDREKLTTFIGSKKMAWPQYFDGKGWENKLAQKYGVQSIPATYLIDKEGKIIDSNLRGEALEEKLAQVLK